MILIVAALGVVVGWLIALLGDGLLRVSGVQSAAARASSGRSPAVLRLLTGRFEPMRDWIDLSGELLLGGLFALLYALHGLSAATLWLMLICAFFTLITLMDWKYRIVLNLLTYPGLIAALVVNIVLLGQPVTNILLGLIFAFVIFYLAGLIVPGGLGGGDVKLAALIGAALGFPLVLAALIVGALASGVTIVVLIAVFRRTLKDSIPYAPFLCLGMVAVLIYSSTLML